MLGPSSNLARAKFSGTKNLIVILRTALEHLPETITGSDG